MEYQDEEYNMHRITNNNDVFARIFHMYVLHDDVIKWKQFRVSDPLCGEFTGEFP